MLNIIIVEHNYYYIGEIYEHCNKSYSINNRLSSESVIVQGSMLIEIMEIIIKIMGYLYTL